MTDYKPGDVVTLEHDNGSRLVAAVMHTAANGLPTLDAVCGNAFNLAELSDDGWRVTDHKPKIELPTEPGWYQDREGDTWKLDDAGVWAMGGDYDSAFRPKECAPFTRLVPEGSEREAAIREVIEWYEAMLWADGFLVTHANARDKFGILK